MELSVIIPNYNNSCYLEQCVDSIINQTYKVNEIIIVDDKSTDNSREIIECLKNKYKCIKVIFLETNRGVSVARNIGLEKACSEYVTFIDADDFYFNSKKLENEMNLIKEYAKLGKDILAYSVTANVSQYGKLLSGFLNKHWIKNEFMCGEVLCQIIAMSKQNRIPRDYCIKKSILKNVGAYSFYKDFYEDLDLLVRIACSGVEFQCTYEHGTAYRKKENGLSNRAKIEHRKTKKEIMSIYYSRLSRGERVKVQLIKMFPFSRFI